MLTRYLHSRHKETGKIVALKVVDVDSTDYKANAREKDENIKDFIHEIKVLKQLKESKAKNVNCIYDAFSIHSQLWIVSEYCPGGSVHTLVSKTGFQGVFSVSEAILVCFKAFPYFQLCLFFPQVLSSLYLQVARPLPCSLSCIPCNRCPSTSLSRCT